MNAGWDTFKLAVIVGGVLAVIVIDAVLVILIPRRHQLRWFLFLAAAYNLLLGGGLLLLLIGILSGIYMQPFILSISEPQLTFQLFFLSSIFVGMVAFIFGCGYLQSARGKAPVRTFLLYGGAIKYGVFAISAAFFPMLPDDVPISIVPLPYAVFVGGGLLNLLFAILFSYLYRTSMEQSP
jgi:hypothetical protein